MPCKRLDLTGLRCPIPVIRLEAALRRLLPGERLEVLADDPLARIDLPHAAREADVPCETLPDPAPGVFAFAIGPRT